MSVDKKYTQTRQLKENCILEERKIASIKATLREEEPQKLISIIESLEGSREKIDEYVARIIGINIKIITVTRNWRIIIKKIIIEEGKEVLNTALEELEQELTRVKEAERSEIKLE